MMSLLGQISKLLSQNQRVVFAIKTSAAVFLVFCCRYMDSFIDMYHVLGDLMFCHQPALEWMAAKRSRPNG